MVQPLIDPLISQVLRYNLTERKTLQSYKLNYFIKQRVIILIRSDSQLMAVQYLSSINLLKPTTVYSLAHCWAKHTVFFQPFLKFASFHYSSLSRYSFLHSRSLPTTTTTATLTEFPHTFTKCSRSLKKNVVLCNNCVTWWNVPESSMVRMSDDEMRI